MAKIIGAVFLFLSWWYFYELGHIRGESAGINWARTQIYGERAASEKPYSEFQGVWWQKRYEEIVAGWRKQIGVK